MPTPPEIDELAKRYLDLWQEHLSGMAVDPEWGAAMTRLLRRSSLRPWDQMACQRVSIHFLRSLGKIPAMPTYPTSRKGPRPDRAPASAQALASGLPNCKTHTPQTGHIGMMVGHNAEKSVWRPLET
jgi:hypothetical protein